VAENSAMCRFESAKCSCWSLFSISSYVHWTYSARRSVFSAERLPVNDFVPASLDIDIYLFIHSLIHTIATTETQLETSKTKARGYVAYVFYFLKDTRVR